jgi:hypothetical protein
MVALRDAAQEAATVGAICPTNQNIIKSRLRASAESPLDMSKLADSQIQIDIVNAVGTVVNTVALGNSIQVTVTYQHEIVTPFVGSFIGTQRYPLKVSVADTILRLDCKAIQ